MNVNLLMFFDVPPVQGVLGFFAAVVFFVMCFVAAIIAFFVLKKTLKMAKRLAVVAVILAVAVIGGISFIWIGVKTSPPHQYPPRQQPTSTRTP